MRSFSFMVLVFLLIACGTAIHAQQPRFPDITGWTKTLGETVYTPDNLWDFIDGAAEAYNSFGFVELTLAE